MKGETVADKEESDTYHHLKERNISSFQRSLHLSSHIDPSKITASMNDGVLQVMIPKDAKKTLVSQIAIQ